ncbi:MAG TPA: GH3 auxin-responsive promoter family protein, partial [Caldilineaceae bacterium]|nr:GH3 auxin-responsive promoter family protein [Caldilineaceae bacterium]
MLLPLVVNRLWLASAALAARRFRRALANPAAAQAAVLRGILRANQRCEAGCQAGFAAISSVEEFQRCVSLCDYDTIAPAIARMAAGEAQVLTAEPVRLFEPSSGSTAAAKLIPYTRRLQREFQAGLSAWISNLFGHYPALARGPAYWSISPLVEPGRRTAGGTPIGFEEDSAYLGPLGRLVERALAVPNGVKRLADVETFRYVTLYYLLHSRELRLVSVWNPTFFTLLLDALPCWWDALLADVAQGTLTPPGALPAEAAAGLRRLRPDPARARALAAVDPSSPTAAAQVWPRLGLLSCWADGAAARDAGELAARLPHAHLQPKGLLATEAMVSLPWVGAPGAVLALTSHFLEFEEESGALRLAHELEVGGVYSVAVTTGGGLYRYRLYDQVEVVGRVAATPCIRFVGKGDRISDRFGEKLTEPFVAACLRELFERVGLAPAFALLAPEDAAGAPAYALFVELKMPLPPGLATDLDEALRRNFHYDYCRRLGQLGPAQV